MEEAILSSPDPLNDSPTFQSPPKTRRSSRSRRSLPLQSSSPTKQTFELDVGNKLSPQKLIVTVEAGSDGQDNYSRLVEDRSSSPSRAPVNRRRERTTTTTIPVKGLSDSEDEVQEALTPRRGRGRPRKSTGTPVPAKKGRAGTPVRKSSGRRRSIGDLVDGDDEEDIDFQIGKDVEIGRGKGRSRSRSTKGTTRKSTPASKRPESDRIVSSTTSKKGRGRRKTLVPEEVVVREDTSCSSNNGGNPSEHPEMSGALQPIHANGPPSAYSTIRSTTTIGGDEPDVVIARFDPGNETPRRTGWSSPRIIETERPSSYAQKATGYLSPSASPEKSRLNQSGDESIAMVAVPTSDRQDSASTHEYGDNGGGDSYEEGDGLGEIREFDTILESEGFSMISVESVPSLREHLSSPANQEEKALTKPIRNKNVESVKQTAAYDDSFSSIPEDVLEAATPGRRIQSQNLLPVPAGRADDSFSSVPPEILEAATPARKTQVSKLRSSKPPMEDSFSSIAPEILEAATPAGTPLKKPTIAPKSLNSEAYEDSFSAIPSAVLDAATPATKRPASSKTDGAVSERLTVQRPRSSVSPSHSATTRLLTPEETPSPGDEPSDSSLEPGGKARMPQLSSLVVEHTSTNESSLMHSHMPSSPPVIAPRRYTYTAHLRRRSQLHPDVTQTPSIVFSSPTLPPPINPPRGQTTVPVQPEQSQRPALSSIARAGQALQNIVVPSSPRSRSHSLGSPFKSPAAERKSPSSVATEHFPSPSQERGIKHLPPFDLNGDICSRSSQINGWTRSVHDDPFSNNAPVQQRSPSPEEKHQYTLGLPNHQRLSDPRLSTIRSAAESIRSDDAMSWQAEEEISAPEGSSTCQEHHSAAGDSTGAWEQKWATERAVVSKQVASADPNQVIVIDSDDEYANNENGDEYEDFGLLLETLNSSSPIAPQPKEQPKNQVEKPRRSKIPSLWRKNSKRLVYSDELSHLSSPPAIGRSFLAKDLTKDTTSKPITVRHIETPELSDEVDPMNLSGWQIPQKSNFKPRPRESGNLDLSALLATSPAKQLPVLSTSSQQFSTRMLSTSNAASNTGVSGGPRARPDDFKSTEQKMPFGPIPQKAGFNPRSHESSPVKQSGSLGLFSQPPKNTLFSPFVEPASSTASQGRTPLSPSRAKTLNRQQPTSVQPSPAVSDDDSASFPQCSNIEKENNVMQSRTLKWTESLRLSSNIQTPQPAPTTTSPTKSCLRTPLKTHSAGSYSTNQSPNKNVQFVSSSPLPSPSQEVLSPTTWSRDHWVLLDTIRHYHKPENNTSPSGSSGSETDSNGNVRKRRNSTRVISRLLGKTVRSQGEKMVLEQWHLEVVDEFRGRVPGWEEKAIAMRVFALIVGEERRKLGLIGGRMEYDEEVTA